jgi:hypothetical protein
MGRFLEGLILFTIVAAGVYLIFGVDEKQPPGKKLTIEQEITKPQHLPDKGLAHDLKEWLIKNTPAK